MQEIPIVQEQHQWALSLLQRADLFSSLQLSDLDVVLMYAKLYEYEAQETLIREGDFSDSFFLIMDGELSIMVAYGETDELIEIGRLLPTNIVGEMGVLLDNPRTAYVVAATKARVLRFGAEAFDIMIERIQGFARQLSVTLAQRLLRSLRWVPLPDFGEEIPPEALELSVIRMLPPLFVQRHSLLPLRVDQHVVQIGFVNEPTSDLVRAIRRLIPNLTLRLFRISNTYFDQILKSKGLLGDEHTPDPPVVVGVLAQDGSRSSSQLTPAQPFQLGRLLQRMTAEGASDLHLPACRKPRWRINGELFELSDSRELGHLEALQLFDNLMPQHCKQSFDEELHVDFSFSVEGAARFRVHLFRDDRGISAVLRLVPLQVPTLKQLKVPPAVQQLAEFQQGLVLISGPNGQGKTTTLAALVDHINRHRRSHIITIEDPIEFVHPSLQCLINQRELGTHVRSLSGGIQAAMREDPDVIVLGLLQNAEQVSMAIEAAANGHLVYAMSSAHTSINVLERIFEMFSPEQHVQMRVSLAEVLRGISNQVLCRRSGGGRVAAFEVMTADANTAMVVRQGNLPQLLPMMKEGFSHLTRNEHLLDLLRPSLVEVREAMLHTSDPEDLRLRLNREEKAIRVANASSDALEASEE